MSVSECDLSAISFNLFSRLSQLSCLCVVCVYICSELGQSLVNLTMHLLHLQCRQNDRRRRVAGKYVPIYINPSIHRSEGERNWIPPGKLEVRKPTTCGCVTCCVRPTD